MKVAVHLVLFLLLPFGVFSKETGNDWISAPLVSQEVKELAGTVVLSERILPVLKSNGKDYLLLVRPDEPGAQDMKNGMAIIVKGTVKTIIEKGQPTRMLLRPSEITIRGETVKFKDLDELTQDNSLDW